MTDVVDITPINVIDFFRAKSEEMKTAVSRTNMHRAIDALCSFCGEVHLSFDSFDENFIGEWIAYLLFCGYSLKTISSSYLKRLSSLYSKAVEAGLARPTDAFSIQLARLNIPEATIIDKTTDKNIFAKLQALLRSNCGSNMARQLAKDITALAIYNGGMSFDEIASFTKDSYCGDNPHILEIVSRYSKPRNKYLFPLAQIHSTSRQLSRRVELMFTNTLINSKLAPNTPAGIWAMAAMSCGISASEIAACIPAESRKFTIAAYATPALLNSGQIAGFRRRVSDTLADNPSRWYAMHLRRHVDFNMLQTRLAERGITLEQTYYPMEEIMRKVGRRKVFEKRPVISWLLFFREKETELNRLYHHIGDLAWGYRSSRSLNGQYAPVADIDIFNYQQAIGTLTPNTHLMPDEEIDIQPGDTVILLGGPLQGHKAKYISEIHTDRHCGPNHTIYRLHLSDGTNANWIVDCDPRMVKKA